jgi:hypothetical protein
VNSEKQLIIKPLGDYFKSMQKNWFLCAAHCENWIDATI